MLPAGGTTPARVAAQVSRRYVDRVPDDPIAKAFLSYAHLDNDSEGGRILRLKGLIENEFLLLTGSRIEIFTDDSGILWGDDWRERIEEALQETTFFIPVLTPTYFVRDECRSEMTRFTTAASDLGLRKLLLSIRYIPVPDLRDDSVDDLKAKAAAMQFEPWDQLRLVAEDSPEHRQAINRMATRLVQLTQDLESGSTGASPRVDSATLIAPRPGPQPTTEQPATDRPAPASEPAPEEPDEDGDDDEDGPLDVLADAQPAMEAWAQTLARLPTVTTAFNDKFSAATIELEAANHQPNSFARKVQVARSLARDVEPELSEIESLSKEYSEGLSRVDRMIRAMYEMAHLASDESAADNLATLNGTVQTLIQASQSARGGLQRAADAARANAKLSKDLRPVLRRFETAVRNIIDGTTIIESWGDLGGA